VGYLGFVPAGDGVVAGVHPDRVLPGAEPERGLVVTGAVTAARPSGAGWEADLLVGDAPFTCRLPARLDGAQVSVTLLDPPYFGLDGASVATANILRKPQ
jgi:hypothetical protein